MGEKWQWAEDIESIVREDVEQTTTDVLAALNALETDKVALLVALDGFLVAAKSLCRDCDRWGFGSVNGHGYHVTETVQWDLCKAPNVIRLMAHRSTALLSRLRSEGAEVNAGE